MDAYPGYTREALEMPLVFIHGVNTRNTDDDYYRAAAARRKMFETYVLPVVRKRGFENFAVLDDIYWGDLGVRFFWNLQSIPVTKVLDQLGAEEKASQDNVDLLQVLAAADTVAAPAGAVAAEQLPEVEKLGSASEANLLAAAENDPAGLVRAIFAPQAERFAPVVPDPGANAPAAADASREKAESEGEQLALLLRAVDQFAEDVARQPNLIVAPSDREILDKIRNGVEQRYGALLQLLAGDEALAGGAEKLGRLGDAVGWARDRLQDALDSARDLADRAKDTALRGGSLLLSERFRHGLSARGLRFFGDVLVYLQRGRTANPSIRERVKQGLASCKGDADNREPVIVVTHSFGSEIFYDLATSGDLDDLTVDLWVTVGAQTSLFGEMRLFASSPGNVPGKETKFLGKPRNVVRWINVYDAADVLSFVHEPVFGPSAVTDIPMREGANLGNAHGAYFVVPSFYQTIAEAAERVLAARQAP
jgi:hypothetical protein